MKIKRFLKETGYAAYLGAALAACGMTFLSWKFYVILIPTIILVLWRES